MINISNINISNINMKAMGKITKEMALSMKIICLGEYNDFYSNDVNEEKQSYLNLIFSNNYTLNEMDEFKINYLLEGCYGLKNNKSTNFEFEYILEKAIVKNVSDIHIEPYENFANVRFREDGILKIVNKVNLNFYNKLVNKVKVVGNLDISKKSEPQDGKLKYIYEDVPYDVRISIIPTINGEKAVLRLLYKDKSLINLSNLSFNKEQREIIDKLLAINNGIVLVSGPTGSGKSTTLYAFINSFNKEKKNITTIEDPVEFNIDGIVQSSINEKIGFNFSKGLKHLLRQDPDIILIGEIRDEETAQIAVRASITGHKVLGTIHTNSALDTYYRLMDMGVEPYLLKQSLKGAISQRLIRKLCPHCKKSYICSDFSKENIKLYKKIGCKECSYSGYKGRIMVSEVLDFEEVDLSKGYSNNSKLMERAREFLLDGEISREDYILFKEGELVEKLKN